jgi:ricin-type beta-trefoil lectin protein
MRQLTALFCVLVLTSACGPDRRELSTLAGPSMTVLAPALPPPSPQLSAPAPREISVGEEVNDALHFQKCLDVNGWSAADGIPLLQWACHGGDNQLWSLEAVADGYSRIVSRHSGKCLDVNGASTDDGASVIQWECHGGANQIWLLRSVTHGSAWLPGK